MIVDRKALIICTQRMQNLLFLASYQNPVKTYHIQLCSFLLNRFVVCWTSWGNGTKRQWVRLLGSQYQNVGRTWRQPATKPGGVVVKGTARKKLIWKVTRGKCKMEEQDDEPRTTAGPPRPLRNCSHDVKPWHRQPQYPMPLSPPHCSARTSFLPPEIAILPIHHLSPSTMIIFC